ncbi:unnamed protein product [Rotaria sp. Silwood2]|nr:unnamed protein product [Rotaria sp. Silwood2]CAF2962493.1 unnamed protein product [Rotaria sp. Silwood2]CAF4339068.1 unnamed protein product [Rotaria sp. Silwood2]CAF4348183.1 unnamed protein product [Rotaria sp. Silwood2]
MANSSASSVDLSIVNNDQSIQVCDVENSSTNEKSNTTISANSKMISKRKKTYKIRRQLTYKLNQMKQVIYEENLIREKIHRLNLEKQHIQSLLLQLHIIESIDRKKHSRRR